MRRSKPGRTGREGWREKAGQDGKGGLEGEGRAGREGRAGGRRLGMTGKRAGEPAVVNGGPNTNVFLFWSGHGLPRRPLQ